MLAALSQVVTHGQQRCNLPVGSRHAELCILHNDIFRPYFPPKCRQDFRFTTASRAALSSFQLGASLSASSNFASAALDLS